MKGALGLFFTLLFAYVQTVPIQDQGLELLILHNNDMHARFEQTSKLGGTCKDGIKCYGGFARVAHVVREAKRNASTGAGPEVLFLNAGDTYQGTPWYSLFKWNITSRFLNLLSPDAISLGNHEFDDGVQGLVPFLNHANFPILTTNLNLSKVPEMKSAKQLMNSYVFDIKGTKVGVIGYLTPSTKIMTPKNDVEFIDEVPAINKEAAALKAKGINILIALGHSGYEMDQTIAKDCPDIDLVIGGHTNTFLWNGKQPDYETPEGPYPLVMMQKSGRKVPVVQAYAFTKYLGKILIHFDKNGEITAFDGQPLLLDESIEQDQDVLDLLEVYRPGIIKMAKTVVGRTKVLLDGTTQSCRRKECNMGNMITDSMVYSYAVTYNGPTWSDVSIGILQGGGVRNSIDARKHQGDITGADILSVLPFDNTLVTAEYKGKHIKEALEWSVHRTHPTVGYGEFLQMSGLKVVYDLHEEPGSRVKDVQVLCTDCDIPEYKELDLEKTYKIITTSFLIQGADGFNVLTDNVIGSIVSTDLNDYLSLQAYIEQKSPVYPAIEGRITFLPGSAAQISLNLVLLCASLLVKYLW